LKTITTGAAIAIAMSVPALLGRRMTSTPISSTIHRMMLGYQRDA